MMAKAMNRSQRGFTLVELMVAMLIGLFVVGGVTKIFMDSRMTDRLRGGMSEVANNARIGMGILAADIARAGFTESPLQDIATFLTATDQDATGSDQIVVSYESDRDCLGNATPVATPRVAENRYFLQLQDGSTDPADEHPSSKSVPDANLWQLYCEGNGSPGNPQPLLSGIESMQFLYGVDSDSDGVADSFDTADYVTSQDAWKQVVAVRIGLLSYSGEKALQGQGQDDHIYHVLNETVDPADGDKRLRQVFEKTVPIRNIIFENMNGG